VQDYLPQIELTSTFFSHYLPAPSVIANGYGIIKETLETIKHFLPIVILAVIKFGDTSNACVPVQRLLVHCCNGVLKNLNNA
jgi:hypothetical protein